MKQTKFPTVLILTVLSISIFSLQLVFHSVKKFDHCVCADGSISYSKGSGSCSQHGGVSKEIYKSENSDLELGDIVFALIITPFLVLIAWVVIIFFFTFFSKNKS